MPRSLFFVKMCAFATNSSYSEHYFLLTTCHHHHHLPAPEAVTSHRLPCKNYENTWIFSGCSMSSRVSPWNHTSPTVIRKRWIYHHRSSAWWDFHGPRERDLARSKRKVVCVFMTLISNDVLDFFFTNRIHMFPCRCKLREQEPMMRQ